MKKIVILAFITVLSVSAFSQNVQLHYDFMKDRNYLTSTIEMFKPDKYGSTFFFVDMDYAADQGKVGLAYLEIARDIKFKEFPVMAHVEYNGGIWAGGGFGSNFNNAYLVGAAFPFKAGPFSLTAQAMYKGIDHAKNGADFQVTGVWFAMFGKFTVTGFVDFWSQDKFLSTKKEFVFLSEPQIWFNAYKAFSVGAEIELSKNFVSSDFEVFPTLGVKVNL